MIFECEITTDTGMEKWQGYVKSFTDHKGFYEIEVAGRGSNLEILIGETSFYRWLCIPNYKISCNLSHWSDVFWNREQLTGLIGCIDAETVAEALNVVQYIIN